MDWVPAISRWIHLLAGVMWIGLLYYFNFVNVAAAKAAAADGTAAGISKHVMPRALFWFRWAAVVTWLAGAALLGRHFLDAFLFLNKSYYAIGVGAWLGTIMLINVWGLIWPNQKKILGMVRATDEEKNTARRRRLVDAEDRRAGPDALSGEPAVAHFQRELGGCRRAMRGFGPRLHVGNADDPSLFVQKRHRKRDQGVLHPHAVDFGPREHEEHAFIGTERLAEHETLPPRVEGIGHFGANEVDAGGKLHRRQLGKGGCGRHGAHTNPDLQAKPSHHTRK